MRHRHSDPAAVVARIGGCGPRRWMLVALLTAAPLTAAHGQPEPAASAPAAAQPPDDLVELNRAIQAFFNGQYDEAAAILDGVLARDPNNTACLYYLGLVHLERGLTLSVAGQPDEARRAFETAGAHLERVLDVSDPVRPYQAALELGIAQLGRSDLVDLQKQDIDVYVMDAIRTLEQYVAGDSGRVDRKGYFFLGVAYYRLGAAPVARDNRAVSLQAAERNFERAVALARGDHAAGRMEAAELDAFEITVTYYRALIDLQRDHRRQALGRLREVQDHPASGTTLAGNAKDLSEFVENEIQKYPEPLTLTAPGLGPLTVEGGLTFGQYFDSNVVLLGKDTALPRSLQRQYDYKFGTRADFDVSRNFTDRDGIVGESLLIGVGGTTEHFWQPNIPEFDINGYSGRAYVNWEPLADLFLGLQYDYSYTMLGHDPFISSNRVTPVVSLFWRGAPTAEEKRGDVRARTDFYYSYDDRDYFDDIDDDRLDRDGNYHAIGATQTFNLARARELWSGYYADARPNEGRDADRWLKTSVGYVYRNERTQGDEFDLFGNTVFLGFDVPLPYRLAFDFTGEFTWDDYTQASLLDFRRNERFDFIQRYIFGLTRTFVGEGENRALPTLSVKGRAMIEITYQDSNVWDRLSQDVFSYTRTVYGLQLMIQF